MSETINVGLTPEEVEAFRKEQAEKKQREQTEAKRKETLNSLLEGENGDVYKKFYSEYGLKEDIEKTPEILDSPVALTYAVKEAKARFEAQQNKSQEPEQEQQKVETPAPITPMNNAAEEKVERKELDPIADMFDPEMQKNLTENEKILLKINAPGEVPQRRQF